MKATLPPHARKSRLALWTILALVPFALTLPSTALAAEACPNEQLREESNVNPATGQPYSTQLPGCRAYELVSPPNSNGFQVFGSAEARTAFDVTPEGAVFFNSPATFAGTGALQDGHWDDVYRSRRTPSGWVTRDMTPSAGDGGKYLVQASTNGNSVLITTTLSLSPEDLDNPTESTSAGSDLYVVKEDGSTEFVSHGTLPNTINELEKGIASTTCCSLAANGDLSAVAFKTDVPLSALDPGTADNCYVWRNLGSRLAYLMNPPINRPNPPSNCELYAVMADGRPVFESNEEHVLYAGSSSSGAGTALEDATRLGGPSSVFDGVSPSGETVYIAAAEHLVANGDSGPDIYGIDLLNAPPGAPVITCVSCGYAEAGAIFEGQSADGSHVFFRSSNGNLYEHDSSGTYLVAPSADDLSHLVFSANGEYVIALSSAALSSTDINNGPDIYEFTGGAAPRLITSGISNSDHYFPSGVSNDGQRVVYEDETSGSHKVIDEWVAGQTGEITPLDSARTSYSVLGIAGPELKDVFFEANAPLVPQDENAGTTDIYDARLDGGFPASTQSANENFTSNPTAPGATSYPGNLVTYTPPLATLLPNTVTPTPAQKAKVLTRALQLAKALKACRKDKPKLKREVCEKRAKKKYSSKANEISRKAGR